MTQRIDGIVLAAGASRRMGSPKPLLTTGDTTFLERAVHLLRDAGCRYVVAVVNDDDWIERLADVSGAAVIINEAQESEQIDSLRLGIANLPEDSQAVVVLPVDFPKIKLETVKRAIDEFLKFPNSQVLNPSHSGEPGHPVIFASTLYPELLNPDLPNGARTVIDQHAADARTITVDDEGVLIDVDTPDDYEKHA